MVFSSIIFLFYFLPAVLLVYHLLFLPVTIGWHKNLFRRLCNLLLVLVSLIFYFWGENFLVWIVLASTTIDYICGLLISDGFSLGEIELLDGSARRTSLQKFGLGLSICSNLAFLGFFKYFNFGVDNVRIGLQTMGFEPGALVQAPEIMLPLGISFYTFQSMSYTIDIYRGNVKATRNLVDFACYVTMFPQLVAGPIVRYRDVATQLVSRTITSSLFASGVERFTLGLGKKVLIANTVAIAADGIFSIDAQDLTMPLAWLGVIAYALQIYFDFSGYSDMAIGLGRMFGFKYLENFNYPYIATSIQDFWRRWHISLSTWFRDYLFIPLGGSRTTNLKTYRNLVVVFLLCGLWHGASWSFVVWGLFHGTFLVAERLGLERVTRKLPSWLQHLYTLVVVLVGWVFFRADTLESAVAYLGAMAGFGSGDGIVHSVAEYLSPDIAIAILLGTAASLPIVPTIAAAWQRAPSRRQFIPRYLVDASSLLALFTVMLLVAMRLASGSYNPFIYFRF